MYDCTYIHSEFSKIVLSEDVGVNEFISEFAFRVMLHHHLSHFHKIVFIGLLVVITIQNKQFSLVRLHREWREGFL